MYWLLGSKSQLSIENKLLLYEAILKPIWRPAHRAQLSTQIYKYSKDFKNTQEKDSAGDTPTGWRNIPTYSRNLMKEVKTTRRLKRKRPQDSCT